MCDFNVSQNAVFHCHCKLMIIWQLNTFLSIRWQRGDSINNTHSLSLQKSIYKCTTTERRQAFYGFIGLLTFCFTAEGKRSVFTYPGAKQKGKWGTTWEMLLKMLKSKPNGVKALVHPRLNSMVQNYKASGEIGSNKSHLIQVRGSREPGSPGWLSHLNGLMKQKQLGVGFCPAHYSPTDELPKNGRKPKLLKWLLV